jgi:hypothetical protein
MNTSEDDARLKQAYYRGWDDFMDAAGGDNSGDYAQDAAARSAYAMGRAEAGNFVELFGTRPAAAGLFGDARAA